MIADLGASRRRRWLFVDFGSRDAVLRLPSIACELALADAYHRVLGA